MEKKISTWKSTSKVYGIFVKLWILEMNDFKKEMVFHCRCFSFSLEEEQEIDYETTTQVQSTPTPTFYTASSNFNLSATDSQTNSSLFSNNIRVFTFSELKEATNNFIQSARIGEGGFGHVYTSVINNPRDSTITLNVAVKQTPQNRITGAQRVGDGG